MSATPAYLAAVAAASKKYGVPPELLAAQIQAESGWNKDAKSPVGATGISQFMPGTAKGMGIDPNDPFQSIDAQGKMMGRLIKSYGGNKDKALAAYNAGAGNVAKYGGIPPFPETQKYISNIHDYEKNYPGLKAGKWGAVSGATVDRAGTYKHIVKNVIAPSVTSPNGSLASAPSDSSSGAFDSSQALLGYLTKQSTPGHGANDPTQELMHALQANQVTLTTYGTSSRGSGSKTIPVQRDTSLQVDKTEAKVVSLAKTYLGTPYVYGGSKPGGFDCSGFVQYVHRQNGVDVPRTTYQQLKAGKPVAKKDLKVGDVVFFHGGSHEGMYIGNGKFIQSPHTGDVVKISDLNTYGGYFAARRFGK